VILVEVLDRRGELLRRERLGELPYRIGRAFDNHLVLDDPYVCPFHAAVERAEDGGLVLRDLGSLNGLLRLPGRAREPRLEVAPDLSVQLGRSVLRFRDARLPVPEALRLRRRPAWLEWALTHGAAGVLWAALLVGVLLLDVLRSSTGEIDWVEQATTAGGTVLVAALWAGGWALVGRLLGQHARFVAHFAIAVVVLLAGIVQQRLFELGQFLFEPIDPVRIADDVGDGVLLAAAVFAHLSVLRAVRVARRAAVAGALGLALLALELGMQYSEPTDWVAVLPYWSRLEPVPPDLLPVEPADAFFAEAKGLEAELLALREELEAEAKRASREEP
jgi:hypothetical protein